MALYLYRFLVYEANVHHQNGTIDNVPIEGVLIKIHAEASEDRGPSIILGTTNILGECDVYFEQTSLTGISFTRLGFNEFVLDSANGNGYYEIQLTTNGELATNHRLSLIFDDYFNYPPQSNQTHELTKSLKDGEISDEFVKNSWPSDPDSMFTNPPNRFLRLSDVYSHVVNGDPFDPIIPPIIIPEDDLPYVFFFRSGVRYPDHPVYQAHWLLKNQLRIDEINDTIRPANELITEDDFHNKVMINIHQNNITVNSNWAYVVGLLESNIVSFFNKYTTRWALAPINGYDLDVGNIPSRIESGAVVSFCGTLDSYNNECSTFDGSGYLNSPLYNLSNVNFYKPYYERYSGHSICVGVYDTHNNGALSSHNLAVPRDSYNAPIGYCAALLRVQINNFDDLNDIVFISSTNY